MEFTAAIDSPVALVVGGGETGTVTIMVHPLTRKQAGELLARWQREDRDEIVADCKLAGLSGVETARLLLEHAERAHTYSHALGQCVRIDRAYQTVSAAAGNPAADTWTIAPRDLISASLHAWGVEAAPSVPSGESGDGASRPTGAPPSPAAQ